MIYYAIEVEERFDFIYIDILNAENQEIEIFLDQLYQFKFEKFEEEQSKNLKELIQELIFKEDKFIKCGEEEISKFLTFKDKGVRDIIKKILE